MIKVKVYVTLKSGVLDPQGKAVEKALHAMDYSHVKDMRVGKYMEFYLTDDGHVQAQIDEMCQKLLSNPVIEDYRYECEEVAQS